MPTPRSPLLLSLSALLVAGCNVERIEIETGRQAILGGTRDTGDPALVSVIAFDSSGTNATYACSGVVVSPHVVVTAAHCLVPSETGPDASFRVYLGDSWNSSVQWGKASNWLAAAEVVPSPGFNPPLATTEDIGLVATKQAIPVTPVALQRDPLTDSLVGGSARLVGLGQIDGSDENSVGDKYQVTTTVASLDGEYIGITDQDHTFCHGDSGGGLFVTQEGVERLAGVIDKRRHTQAGPPCSGPALSTRVDVYAAGFIDPFIAAHEAAVADGGGDSDGSSPDGAADSRGPGTSSGGCQIGFGADPDAGRLTTSLALLALLLRLGTRRRQSGA